MLAPSVPEYQEYIHGGRLVADSAAERFFGAKKGRALSDREYPKDIYRCAGLGLYMNIITPETHFRAVYTTISRFEDLKLSANSYKLLTKV